MKILVLGAGGIGGFFGSHLHEVGEDVTFLVREERKPVIEKNGIQIKSPIGNLSIQPNLITKNELTPMYDIVLLTCKSYNLNEVIADLDLLNGHGTIIPFLNGQTHLQKLDIHFDKKNIYGGVAYISSNVNESGVIEHVGKNNKITFGSRIGENSDLIKDFYKRCVKTKFDASLSNNIDQDVWEKWIFIATLAGATTLFKTSLDKINMSREGMMFIMGLFNECCQISKLNGFEIREEVKNIHESFFVNKNSKVKASMLIDMEKKSITEHEHIFKELIKLGINKGFESNILKIIYLNMLIYEDSNLI